MNWDILTCELTCEIQKSITWIARSTPFPIDTFVASSLPTGIFLLLAPSVTHIRARTLLRLDGHTSIEHGNKVEYSIDRLFVCMTSVTFHRSLLIVQGNKTLFHPHPHNFIEYYDTTLLPVKVIVTITVSGQ